MQDDNDRVTLQDIADQLGISKFAVSRALTGKAGVSEATRKTVMEMATHLGYRARPRPAAVRRAIEVIFRDRTVAARELWIDVQSGVDAESVRQGFSMTVRWTDDPSIIAQLETEVAGFILIGPQPPDMFAAVRRSSRPAVAVNHVVPVLDTIDQISATDAEAGLYVARFLYGLGHRKLVYAHGRLGYPGREARLRGFSDASRSNPGMEVREIAFVDDQAADDLRTALLSMVEEDFEPTAIFCGSDGVAVTVVSELMRMGLRVPEDVSVVGHADYEIATQISPQLSTVHMPHRQMGLAAVRLLLSRSASSDPQSELPPQRVELVPWLVERQSTGPATKRSWRGRLRRHRDTD